MAKLLSGTRIYGTANVDSYLAVGGTLFSTAGVTSTSNSTGSIVVTGGIGVTGNIYSTGIVTGTFSGVGSSITGISANNLIGTLPSSVYANSVLYIGTTSIALNRASASQSLTGITSIDGNAATATTLATARNINGVSFNGSADITVTANAATLTGSNLPALNASLLTNVPAANLTGTISSTVLGNSTHYIGTTAIALNRASASQSLTGITSIDGSAASVANALTINNGGAGSASGTTYNGSSAVTLSYNSIGASPLAGSSSLTTTGTVTSGTWSGSFGAVSGANLTNLTANNLIGTVPSTVLANSSMYIGTTSVPLNRATGALSLSGVSIDGTAGSVTAALTFNTTGGVVAGTTYNGGTARTIDYSSVGASPLAGSSSLTTTGTVTSGTWSGSFGAVSGANLTNLTAGNLAGTIPSTVLGNSTHYIGTTAIALNRASAAQSLTGITSIDGYAADVAGGLANQILYQTGPNVTSYIDAPTTTNTVLTWTGTAFSWNVAASGGGGSGATLSTADGISTYYIGLSANTSGNWTDARVDPSNLYYNSSTDTLYSTNYNTASDKNLKDNIITINNSLDTVNKLNAVEFTWKNTGKKSYGIIAQELEKILPELVDDTEGRKTVNYNGLIGFLIGAVKELSDKVEQLEKK